MSVSRVHHCIEQKRIVRRTVEPPVKKACKCRKFITLKEATQLVKDRDAEWTVTKRRYVTRDELCGMCLGDSGNWKTTCSRCSGKGVLSITREETDHSNDIVLIDQKGAVYEKPKTPRTATCESEHMERAYSDGLVKGLKAVAVPGVKNQLFFPKQWDKPNEARDRIEEYGRLIVDARHYVGADKFPAIIAEPENSWERGEGVKYDLGWGAMRTCAFDEGVVFEDKPVKDKPSLDGQRNYEESQSRAYRLAKLMENL